VERANTNNNSHTPLDGAHDARAFDLPGAPMRRRADGGQAAEGGRAHGWARVCRQYMDVLSTNLRSPLAHPERRMRLGRRIGVCFLFGYFLLCTSTAPQERRERRSQPRRGEGQDALSKEKVTRSRSERKLLIEYSTHTPKSLDSGLRRNDDDLKSGVVGTANVPVTKINMDTGLRRYDEV